jgi:hypothetical protein
MEFGIMAKIKSAIEKLREKGIVGKPYAENYQDRIDRKNKEYLETKEKEEARIALIECPSCKSTDKEHIIESNSNGIIGPGYSSWVTNEYFVCNNCGTMFKDISKKKKQ